MPEMSISGAAVYRGGNESSLEDGKFANESSSFDAEDKINSSSRDEKNDDENRTADNMPVAPYRLEGESEAAALFKPTPLPTIELSNGVGPFVRSIGRRFRAAFTPRLILCIVVRC